MFSHGLTCSRFDAVARAGGGAWGSVRLDLDFGSWAQVSRVLPAPRLESYASYLCAKLREEEDGPVELRFIAECRDSRSGPTISMVDPTRNYCSPSP